MTTGDEKKYLNFEPREFKYPISFFNLQEVFDKDGSDNKFLDRTLNSIHRAELTKLSYFGILKQNEYFKFNPYPKTTKDHDDTFFIRLGNFLLILTLFRTERKICEFD